MNITSLSRFARFLRELAVSLLGNTLITLIMWLAGMTGSFMQIWVVTQCIGLGISFSHMLIAGAGAKPRSSHWKLALATGVGALAGVVVSISCGFLPLTISWHDALPLLRLTGLALIIGALATLFFINLNRINELKVAQQEARLRELTQQKQAIDAHLRLLQAQIEPHFLFNTLANLHSLIGHDDALARTLLERLNEYLRLSLHHSRAETGTVADECHLLSTYLDIQALRMGSRLRWEIQIPDIFLPLPLPPMLLQPLVENAICHGIEPHIGAGILSLSAHQQAHFLVFSVCDNGAGLNQQGSGQGVGLSNVRQRLSALYGDEAKLVLRENQPHGVIAEIWIPHAVPAP